MAKFWYDTEWKGIITHEAVLSRMLTNSATDEEIIEHGFEQFEEVAKPDVLDNQIAIMRDITKHEDGVWRQQWEVVNKYVSADDPIGDVKLNKINVLKENFDNYVNLMTNKLNTQIDIIKNLDEEQLETFDPTDVTFWHIEYP